MENVFFNPDPHGSAGDGRYFVMAHSFPVARCATLHVAAQRMDSDGGIPPPGHAERVGHEKSEPLRYFAGS
jgi:hypothetical protein